jgi:hypothetical protein
MQYSHTIPLEVKGFQNDIYQTALYGISTGYAPAGTEKKSGFPVPP